MSDIANTLARCILDSLTTETREFQWDVFFRQWFRTHGQPYFFLFKKHLGVTNTQLVELFALLETYCTDPRSGKPKCQLLFHSTEDIKETLVETLNTVLDAKGDAQADAITDFAIRYAEVLGSTVAVDLFYCSAAIALPPGIVINLNQVCADSGYIHSAGRSIYIRNIRKARASDFKDRLAQHVQSIEAPQLPIPFVVYAHEDFSDYDAPAKDQISRGIDTTKLYLEKMSMGAYRLADIVEDLRREMPDTLTIPPPGSYTRYHNFHSHRTLWLISERSLSKANPTNLGRERYYICYEQSVKSENPFFLFDENKPAWKSHTTLPHSLTAALINIARPRSPEAIYCDPFGGTGTTWLEANRLRLSTTTYTSDVSPIAPLMIHDNLDFFLSPAMKLMELRNKLREIDKAIKRSGETQSGRPNQREMELPSESEASVALHPYSEACKFLQELKDEQPKEDQEYLFTDDFVRRIGLLKPLTRFLFYVALRAQFRYQGGLKRRATNFKTAFTKSLKQLTGEIDQLIKVRRDIEKSASPGECANYSLFQGVYSKGVVSSFFLQSPNAFCSDLSSTATTQDARNLNKNSVDVIICDPPYGFNTTEDQSTLARLYSEFIDAAINALRDGGQLIICLPAESYTGRDLPYCTRSDLITSQVLLKTQSARRHVYVPARSLPISGLSPPYYWEADRALRRVILHFCLS